MSVLVATLQGRNGNQILQYLFCRGYAEAHSLELRTDPWIGERIFHIEHPRPEKTYPREGEIQMTKSRLFQEVALPQLCREHGGIEFRGYAQIQACVNYYTKRKAQKWLQIRPEWLPALQKAVDDAPYCIIGHRRLGDYKDLGYPLVSEASYYIACMKYGLNPMAMKILTEASPTLSPDIPDDLSFLVDFYRMMTAPTLLRGNSSFSWLAGLLGNGLILSPVIDGLAGGVEHDVLFIPGNHPKFAPNLDFVEDLYVSQ